jgi:6-pyruvoyltetrahydropterin/6-carboxytetrahydropterin synthase
MLTSYHIRLDKQHHVFSAAHFITFAGNICERLHGHNYRVACEVHGELDENQYVVDFIAVRDGLRKILDELEHRMLLPTSHPLIRVVADAKEVTAIFLPDGRRWVFPADDCVLLPVANTTAELLANWIGIRLLSALEQKTGSRPRRVQIGVDENNGQWGICELTGE